MEVDTNEENDGTIISIHMRNWFCLENLKIKFNRNVNFIVGRNGCGKSAILSALVIGLGSRADITYRGNNVQCEYFIETLTKNLKVFAPFMTTLVI